MMTFCLPRTTKVTKIPPNPFAKGGLELPFFVKGESVSFPLS
jgi:hypothetical protein